MLERRMNPSVVDGNGCCIVRNFHPFLSLPIPAGRISTPVQSSKWPSQQHAPTMSSKSCCGESHFNACRFFFSPLKMSPPQKCCRTPTLGNLIDYTVLIPINLHHDLWILYPLSSVQWSELSYHQSLSNLVIIPANSEFSMTKKSRSSLSKPTGTKMTITKELIGGACQQTVTCSIWMV